MQSSKRMLVTMWEKVLSNRGSRSPFDAWWLYGILGNLLSDNGSRAAHYFVEEHASTTSGLQLCVSMTESGWQSDACLPDLPQPHYSIQSKSQTRWYRRDRRCNRRLRRRRGRRVSALVVGKSQTSRKNSCEPITKDIRHLFCLVTCCVTLKPDLLDHNSSCLETMPYRVGCIV